MTEPPSTPLARRGRHILLAAANLFIKKGFQATSMRDIAKDAGVSLGNLYNHFSGKDALIQGIAVLEAEELAPLIKLLSSNKPPEKRLSTFIDRHFANMVKHENAALGAEIGAEVLRKPAAAAPFTANREALVDAMQLTIEPLLPPGEPAALRRTLHLILGLIEAAAEACVGAPRGEKSAVKAQVHLAVNAIINTPMTRER